MDNNQQKNVLLLCVWSILIVLTIIVIVFDILNTRIGVITVLNIVLLTIDTYMWGYTYKQIKQ